MKNNKLFIPAILLGIAIVILAGGIYKGLKSFADKDRVVTVKGLSEREVDADKANLAITYAVSTNDMPSLLKEIERNNKIVKDFILSKGLNESEITIGVANIKDKQNQEYASNNGMFRYYASVEVSVISSKVSAVRNLEQSQFDLYKQGVNLIRREYYDEPPQNYSFTKLNDIKPDMIKESIEGAKKAADEFAKSSHSKIGSIKSAKQGQFEIIPTDNPLKMKVRVVSTIEYFLK